MDVKIYYENNDFLVCEKPRGVVSQESEKLNMITLLKHQTDSNIYPVHRLDIDTTGLMIYAKNSKTAASLSEQIQNKTFVKKYIAMVDGIPDCISGTMEDYLFFDRQKQKSFIVKKERKGVKKAVLDFKMLYSENNQSVMEIMLHTGRTHQIRAQFSSHRLPVTGDRRYGSKNNTFIHLHCSYLSFKDKSGQRYEYFSYPEWYKTSDTQIERI